MIFSYIEGKNSLNTKSQGLKKVQYQKAEIFI